MKLALCFSVLLVGLSGVSTGCKKQTVPPVSFAVAGPSTKLENGVEITTYKTDDGGRISIKGNEIYLAPPPEIVSVTAIEWLGTLAQQGEVDKIDTNKPIPTPPAEVRIVAAVEWLESLVREQEKDKLDKQKLIETIKASAPTMSAGDTK